jgi:hypothetical protein
MTQKGGGAADLVTYAATAALFHTPDGQPYATFLTEGHFETWPINSPRFRNWLDRRYFNHHSKNAARYAMDSALSVLTGKALWEGETTKVHVRLAEHDGSVWLDLMDDQWRVVEITPDGWSVHDAKKPLPVKFRRAAGGKPLPFPVEGGSIDELRAVCNIHDDDDWKLIVCWLMGLVNPNGPYPALIINGQQGSAK